MEAAAAVGSGSDIEDKRAGFHPTPTPPSNLWIALFFVAFGNSSIEIEEAAVAAAAAAMVTAAPVVFAALCPPDGSVPIPAFCPRTNLRPGAELVAAQAASTGSVEALVALR